MQIIISSTPAKKIESDLLVFFVTDKWEKELNTLGKQISNKVKSITIKEEFKAKYKETIDIDTDSTYSKLLLVGLGDGKDVDYFKLQEIIATTLELVKKIKRKNIAISVHPSWLSNLSSQDLGRGITEALLLSSYSFNKYKSKNEDKPIEKVALITTSANVKEFENGVKTGEIFAKGTILARDLVNEPPARTTPAFLAKTALKIAKDNNKISVTILDEKEVLKLGMGAFLGVTQGSDSPPKFIRLHYKPAGAKNKIVLAGKGITFDTGGLSLKPANSMETMKCDMAGAAAVLGLFSVIGEVKPKVEVVGLIAACENMPSGKALRPGDILRAMNGKTIEVLNTDAEGRLTLADVLSYAVLKEKPDGIIDLATLTGAIMVSLGEDITGLFSNDKKLTDKVISAATEEGEHVWHMPLPDHYKSLIKSNIADLRNTSKGKYGGAITAALFLEEFVDKIPWAHLDIAGPAFAEKNTPLAPYGGTGFGVRLLLHLLTHF